MYVIKIDKGQVAHFPLLCSYFHRQKVTEWHKHECLELVIILGGKGLHGTKAGNHTVSQGDILIIQPGLFHCYPEVDNLELVNILFKPEALPIPFLDSYRIPGFNLMLGIRNSFLLDNNIYPHFQLKPEIFNYVKSLTDIMRYECQNNNTAGFQFSMMGTLMALLCQTARAYTDRFNSESDLFSGINKAVAYLNEHFSSDFNLDKLTRIALMSKSSFMRHFQSVTGTSPLQYVQQLRIAHACHLLQHTSDSITEIGCKCGFQDSSYFSKVFYKIVKSTPKQFRRKIYEQAPQATAYDIREEL